MRSWPCSADLTPSSFSICIPTTTAISWWCRIGTSLALLTPDEQREMMALTTLSEMALTEAFHPQGINVGINLGQAAGAGIENHLHIHLVPRWAGDTNFMTAIGETRVLPEDLRQTAKRLRPVFEKLSRDRA